MALTETLQVTAEPATLPPVAEVLNGCNPGDETANIRLLVDAGYTRAQATNKARQVSSGAQPFQPQRNTDAGNAQRLVEAHGNNFRYLYRLNRWLAWNGKQWAPDATGAVERYARQTVQRMYAVASNLEDPDKRQHAIRWTLQSESSARLEAMMRLARSHEQIVVQGEDLDADGWSLNTQNGIVDLRTGVLRPHDPAEMHTKITTAAYDSDARSERWEAFLLQVLPDAEVRRFVQKLVGYSLTGEVGENVLPFPYGSGANGKSVLLGTLREVLGDYATEAAPDLLVEHHHRGIPVDVMDLAGYRFVTTTEVEGGRRMATDIMKRITGESRLKARRMRQDYESFRNVSTLWMAANDRPAVDGLDEAIWRRVRLIPFTVTIPAAQRDPYLQQTLLEDRDAILAWAVQGCLAWQQEGLQAPSAVLAATDEYRDESNPLADWVESECEVARGAVTPATTLRDAYERWCMVTRSRKLPRGKKWSDALGRLGCTEDRPYIQGKQVRAWTGIQLTQREGMSI